jgi:hypothetical protein
MTVSHAGQRTLKKGLDLGREDVDAGGELAFLFDEILGREGLVGE